jgi:hypothetical protein
VRGPGWIAIPAIAWVFVAAQADANECASCDPQAMIDRARADLDRAFAWDLPQGGDAVVDALVAAEQTAAAGETKIAAHLAQKAAAACLVGGGGACMDSIELLAELEDGAGDFSDEDIAAMLSLAPGKKLTPSTCARAAVLRFRLAGRFADPAWADACGAERAHQGELGYRAAKASLLRADRGGARRRLDQLSLDDAPGFAVRARYLAAVLDVADGHVEQARDAFAAIAAMPPDPERSAEDDEARALAELQLARLWRDLGHPDLALDAYRAVPAGGLGRADALVEGAATAAFLGDHALARAYLAATSAYGNAPRIEVTRLLASLDLVDGDVSAATRGFVALGKEGRAMRAKLVPDPATAEASLAADPSLGGLLDPKDARRLRAVEDDLARLVLELDRAEREVTRLQAIVNGDGPQTPTKRALERVREADRLLRAAEGMLGLDVEPRVASTGKIPHTAAAEAHALRKSVDEALRKLEPRVAREREQTALLLTALDGDLAQQRKSLAQLASASRPVIRKLRSTLIAQAERAVRRLEMSEETGALEIAWRRKVDASIEVKRLTTEYATDKKDLEGEP